MRRLVYAAMAVLLCAFGASGGAVAQSFDCKRATTTIEKIICGNEFYNFRDIDADLGKAFSRRIQGTSAAESRRLLLEQRAWLARRLEACQIGPQDRPEELAAYQTICLDELYEERIDALNRKPIDLLYSGDERVCRRLHKALNAYHESKPSQWSFRWALPTILELSGFEAVRWLDPEDADVFSGGRYPHPAMIFEGDVFGDGTTRFVNMRYSWVGGYGTYGSSVLLLNERVTKKAAEGLMSKIRVARGKQFAEDYWPPAEIVSVYLDFEGEIGEIYKDTKDYSRIFSDSPMIRLASEVGLNATAREIFGKREWRWGPHDAFTIDGRVYFLASGEGPFDGPRGGSLLYRLKSDLSVEVVCLTQGNTIRYATVR